MADKGCEMRPTGHDVLDDLVRTPQPKRPDGHAVEAPAGDFPGMTPALATQLRVSRFGMEVRRLSRLGDPEVFEAEAAYADARRAGEEAGHLMRIVELADLRDRHGAILPPDAEVTVGVGWRGIVDEALDRLSGMHVTVPLIREKFGGLDLKVYPRGKWRSEDFDAVGPAKAPAAEAALRTCEACGAPGTMRKDGRWRTRCDAHVEL